MPVSIADPEAVIVGARGKGAREGDRQRDTEDD